MSERDLMPYFMPYYVTLGKSMNFLGFVFCKRSKKKLAPPSFNPFQAFKSQSSQFLFLAKLWTDLQNEIQNPSGSHLKVVSKLGCDLSICLLGRSVSHVAVSEPWACTLSSLQKLPVVPSLPGLT
jgi:hypothetical protein